MHEILAKLATGARVLDLGSGPGSFGSSIGPFVAIRADLDHPDSPAANFAQADAARLPFANRAFDAVISNHSLEHFENLAGALAEIGRVLKPAGSLYIAVPDASTFCDRLYRWLGRGGGHVNAFTSADRLAAMIERTTHLPLVATRTLHTSLSFLNRKNFRSRAPKRILAVGGGTEISLHLFTYFARLFDRLFRTRLTVYGWAFYFGDVPVPIDERPWTNVCIRCGSGASSDWLRTSNLVHRWSLWQVYRCPNCGTTNLFSDDNRVWRLAVSHPRQAPSPNPQSQPPSDL